MSVDHVGNEKIRLEYNEYNCQDFSMVPILLFQRSKEIFQEILESTMSK